MRTLLALAFVVITAVPAAGADWLQFRGSGQTGVAEGPQPPLSWNTEAGENVAWKADHPRRGP